MILNEVSEKENMQMTHIYIAPHYKLYNLLKANYEKPGNLAIFMYANVKRQYIEPDYVCKSKVRLSNDRFISIAWGSFMF